MLKLENQNNDERKALPFWISNFMLAIYAVVALLSIPFLIISFGQGVLDSILSLGERVTGASYEGTDGVIEGDSLAGCAKIPPSWQPHIEQAADVSGAPAILIAAVLSGGEHESWYRTQRWPNYEDKYSYPSEPNPAIHDGNGWGGYVRGPMQMKEQSFEAYYAKVSRQQGTASRFGTGFKVEPYIEETQASLNAAGAYLADHGGRVGASDTRMRIAIRAYNHSEEYVQRVLSVYKDYLQCAGAVVGGPDGIVYDGNKACPTIASASAGWGPVRRSNPHVPTYPGHEGLDIFAARGTPIYSITDGTVRRIGFGGGWRVWIDDGQGHYWFYQHMIPNEYYVKAGDRVRAGQQIGRMSNSGAESSVVHLHLGIARTMSARTGGTSVMNWADWFFPYDYTHDIPCLNKNLRN